MQKLASFYHEFRSNTIHIFGHCVQPIEHYNMDSLGNRIPESLILTKLNTPKE